MTDYRAGRGSACRHLYSVICHLLASAVLALGVFAPASAGVLVLSTADAGWVSGVWQDSANSRPAEACRDTRVTYTGEGSLCVTRSGDGAGGQAAFWARDVPVSPGRRYRLSARVLMQDLVGEGAYVEMDGVRGAPAISIGQPEGRWVSVSTISRTLPGQTSARVSVGVARCNGSAWFDGIRLEDAGPARQTPAGGARVFSVRSIWAHMPYFGWRPWDAALRSGRTEGHRFDARLYREDMRRFFDDMQRLGITALVGVPGHSQKEKDEFVRECNRRGIQAFLEVTGFPLVRPELQTRDAGGKPTGKPCLWASENVAAALSGRVSGAARDWRSYRDRGLEIAGVCFDGTRWYSECYCDRCREAYRSFEGRLTWAEFRCIPVTRYVREAKRILRAANPDMISCHAIKTPEAFWPVGQNWPQWLEQGLVDYVMPMISSDDSGWSRTLPFGARRGLDQARIVPITYPYYVKSLPSTVRQIELARENGMGGVSFFGWWELYNASQGDLDAGEYAGSPVPDWYRQIARAIRGEN